MENYRVKEGFGPYMNKRWEVQERKFYYDEHGNRVESWHIVFHSADKQECEKICKRYNTAEFTAHQARKREALNLPFNWMEV